MSDDDAQKAIDYIRDSAPIYAKAKAERTYIENYLKVVKATEMANSDKKTLGDREIDAYMSMTYETQLKAMREAVATEEELKYRMEAAKLRFEHYRVLSYNARSEIKALS
jgi:hypothetical protein